MPSAPVLHALHIVVRGTGISAEGVQRERGEVLDTTSWRNVQPLINVRKLAPFYGSEENLITCECGRRWLDAEASAAHRCPERQPAPRQKASA